MNVRQSIFGGVVRLSPEGGILGVDFGTLVRQLLLFDTVIVKSSGLREIPEFIRAFGRAGFLALLIPECSRSLVNSRR